MPSELSEADATERKRKSAEYGREWRARNPEKAKGYQSKYREKHPERAKASTKRWQERNPDRIKERRDALHAANPGYVRNCQLKSEYGITLDQYNAMLVTQDGRCSICKTDAPGGRGCWHVDHCHSSGSVRGLLCTQCNTGLGLFRDNPTVLAAAIDYLGRHNNGPQGCAI